MQAKTDVTNDATKMKINNGGESTFEGMEEFLLKCCGSIMEQVNSLTCVSASCDCAPLKCIKNSKKFDENHGTVNEAATEESTDDEADDTKNMFSNILYPADNAVVCNVLSIKQVVFSDEERYKLHEFAERVRRVGVYTVRYKQSEKEKEEIKELSRLLMEQSVDESQGRSPKKLEEKHRKSLSSTLYPPVVDEEKGQPIILKRESILLQPDAKRNDKVNLHHCDLILLSNAFILSLSHQTASSKGSGVLKRKQKKNNIHCHALSTVAAVIDMDLCTSPSLYFEKSRKNYNGLKRILVSRKTPTKKKERFGNYTITNDSSREDDFCGDAFRIVIDTETTYTFVCASNVHKVLWLDAFNKAILGGSRSRTERFTKGWQHEIVRTNIYSACWFGDSKMLQRIISLLDNMALLNVPDSWGHTAIHYAVIKDHMTCLAILLEAGADPNIIEKDGQSAVDYAYKHKKTRAYDMLILHSLNSVTTRDAIDLIETSSDDTGLSLGGVRPFEILRDRGVKLESVNEASSDMQSNAVNYRDLASQLRQKTQAKGVLLF